MGPAPRGVARLAVQRRRLPGGARAHSRPAKEAPDALVEAPVAGQPEHVLDPRGLEKGQQRGVGEPGIGPHAHPGPGKEHLEFGEQPAQQAADTTRGGPGARPQQRRHQVLHRLGVEGHRGHERQVAPRGVVAIEEGELLLPVGRIVGRIEVDGDEPDTSRRPGSRLARRDNCSCTRRS